ncbi:MAG: hypothetical protein R3D02_15115 [Hyphomicrobiales bacterium]
MAKFSRGLMLAVLAALSVAGCASPRQSASLAPASAPAGVIEPGTTAAPRVMTASAPVAILPASGAPAAAPHVYVAKAPDVSPATGYAESGAPVTASAAVDAVASGSARPGTVPAAVVAAGPAPVVNAPVASAPVATAPARPSRTAATGGAYPNINITPPTSGVALLTPAERASLEAQLRGLSSAHAAAAGSGSPERRAEVEAALRDLAASHSRKAGIGTEADDAGYTN